MRPRLSRAVFVTSTRPEPLRDLRADSESPSVRRGHSFSRFKLRWDAPTRPP